MLFGLSASKSHLWEGSLLSSAALFAVTKSYLFL